MEKESTYEQNDISFDVPNNFPWWCQSDAARFVWTLSQKGFYQLNGLFDEDKMELVNSALHSVSKEELEMFAVTGDVIDRVNLSASHICSMIEEKGASKKNETIDELIEKFYSKEWYPALGIQDELMNRFSEQSHDDQIKILRTFIGSDDENCRVWSYEEMLTWWDDCLIPDIKKAWETDKGAFCAAVVAKRLPIDYVVEQKEALEEADYASVCLRLAADEKYNIDHGRLTRLEFLEIASQNHWHLDDNDADEILFGFALDAFADQPDCYTDWNGKVFLRPSLLRINEMCYYIDAFGKLGKVNTLSKLYDWNRLSKEALMYYHVNPEYREEIITRLSEGHESYLRQIWVRFMDAASKTFPFGAFPEGKVAFRKTHNKYHFAKQSQKDYWPDFSWEKLGL